LYRNAFEQNDVSKFKQTLFLLITVGETKQLTS